MTDVVQSADEKEEKEEATHEDGEIESGMEDFTSSLKSILLPNQFRVLLGSS